MLSWLFLGLAMAEEPANTAQENKGPNSVLVYQFEARDNAADDISSRIPNILLGNMAANPQVQGFSISEMNAVHDQTAQMYADGCPAGEFSGCAYILASGSGVAYAVTGEVSALEVGAQVKVQIIDISTGQEALNFQADIGQDAEGVFAETVTRTILSVMRGDIGGQVDLRQEEESDEIVLEEGTTDELDEYTESSGNPDDVEERSIVDLEQKTLSREQILEMIEEEGSKEWEHLDMGPWEYMRFVNSGLSLPIWRKLNRGRQGQLLIRANLGVARGPSYGKYYGRWARSNFDLSTVETYAWQTIENGNGAQIGGAISFGVLPYLDVGVVGGAMSGRFVIDLHAITVGQFDTAPKPDDLPNSVTYIGPEIQFVPMVISRVKPLLGVSVTFWSGRKATDYVDNFPEPLPDLSGSSMIVLQAAPGVELRLSDYIDFWVRAPVSFLVSASNAPEFQQSGNTGSALQENNRLEPEDFGLFGGGISVGIQTRIGPLGKKDEGLDIYD